MMDQGIKLEEYKSLHLTCSGNLLHCLDFISYTLQIYYWLFIYTWSMNNLLYEVVQTCEIAVGYAIVIDV